MHEPTGPTSPLRQLLVWCGVTIATSILVFQVTHTRGNWPLYDFIRYWTAGRLIATGGDPYSPDQVLALQKQVGWTDDDPLLMWNPPWTLVLVVPFGLLPFDVARLVCLLLQFALSILCANWIWRFYGGTARFHWVSWLISFSYYPLIVVLIIGQISLLVLLAMAGFLYFERRQQGLLAGALAALAAVKPHLVYLFWVALIIWALHGRRWAVLGGAAAVGLFSTAIAWLFDPLVLQQYWHALGHHHPPLDAFTPTFGTFLRIGTGLDTTWLQLVPTMIGILWCLFHWLRCRRTWKWSDELPLLLLVSCLTTFYGAWVLDLVVLLVPVLQSAVWVARIQRRAITISCVLAHLMINAIAMLMRVAGFAEHQFIWFTPVLFCGYLALRWRERRILILVANRGHQERSSFNPVCEPNSHRSEQDPRQHID